MKYPFEIKIRHHVHSHNYLPIDALKNIPENYPPLIDKLDWANFFEDGKHPVMLDIGCGKGLFLLQYAYENPSFNCLGIEIREYPVEWIKSVVKGEELKNCNALRYGVSNGLTFIDSKSIDNVFYLFPDPWPKRKHLKRRAFDMKFVEDIYDKLKDEGIFWISTDVPEVAEYETKILDKFGKFEIIELKNREGWDFPTTNKENFCIEKNIQVFRYKCLKK